MILELKCIVMPRLDWILSIGLQSAQARKSMNTKRKKKLYYDPSVHCVSFTLPICINIPCDPLELEKGVVGSVCDQRILSASPPRTMFIHPKKTPWSWFESQHSGGIVSNDNVMTFNVIWDRVQYVCLYESRCKCRLDAAI